MAARPPTRRLFIAVPLPDEPRAAIERLVDAVRADAGGRSRIRWVRMDGLHLTLRFLGPTPAERTEEVADVVRQVATGSGPFAVELAGAGAFPSADRPRALWLGVTRGGEALADLSADVSDALVARGWPAEERPYRPHLTLARTDGLPDGRTVARSLIDAAAALDIGFAADAICLMESRTGHGPARYERLVAAALAGEADGP